MDKQSLEKHIEYFCKKGLSKKSMAEILGITTYKLNKIIKEHNYDTSEITRNPTTKKKNEMAELIHSFKEGLLVIDNEEKNERIIHSDKSDSDSE